MLHWFNDNYALFCIFFAFVLIILVAIWWRNRKGLFLLAWLVVLVLLGLTFFAEYFIVSDREQITANLKEMALAVEQNQPQTISNHLAESFEFQSRGVVVNKANAVTMIESAVKLNRLQSVFLWNINVEKLDAERGTAHVDYMARPTVDGNRPMFRCESDFVREEDGKWRMQSFKLFKILGDKDTPYDFSIR